MHRSGDIRASPEMPKRMTSTEQLPESTLFKHKRTRSLPAAVQTEWVSNSLVKTQPTQNNSPTREVAWKLFKGTHSHKGKLLSSSENDESTRKGKRKIVDSTADTPEVFYDASKAHLVKSSSSSLVIPLAGGESSLPKLMLEDHGGIASHSWQVSKDSQVTQPHCVLPEVLPNGPQGGESLLQDLVDDIIGRLSMIQVIRLRPELGKAFKNTIHQPAFLRKRPDSEGEFSPSLFMTNDVGELNWYGFDTKLRTWRMLPSLDFVKTTLPSPDPDLFKDYLVAGDGGLLCCNVGKAPGREKLVVCNPLTRQIKVLPPLNYPRHPVLMHLKVDHDSGHYKVFVAGSASIGTEELSLKMEEYDSRKGVWECPNGSDLPCPAFGLNEYQNGAYYKDFERELLLCVAIVDSRGRGVLMYDITKKKWVEGPHVKQLHIPLVRSEPIVSQLVTSQIIEFDGSVFIFSRQESGWDDYFLIHKLILDGPGDFTWDEVMCRTKTSSTISSLEYPEFTCVPVSEHELCIFNTVDQTIEIIDLNNPMEVTTIRAAPAPTLMGHRFHSLNPIGFVFKPSFTEFVCPRGRNFKTRCDLQVREYCSECKRLDSTSFMSVGSPINVFPKVINSRTFEGDVGLKVATTPQEGADTTIVFVEPVESEDKRTEEARKVCEDIRKFLDQYWPELI